MYWSSYGPIISNHLLYLPEKHPFIICSIKPHFTFFHQFFHSHFWDISFAMYTWPLLSMTIWLHIHGQLPSTYICHLTYTWYMTFCYQMTFNWYISSSQQKKNLPPLPLYHFYPDLSILLATMCYDLTLPPLPVMNHHSLYITYTWNTQPYASWNTHGTLLSNHWQHSHGPYLWLMLHSLGHSLWLMSLMILNKFSWTPRYI